MTIDLTKLHTKIAELKASIAASPYTVEEALEARAKISAADFDTKEGLQVLVDQSPIAKRLNDRDTLWDFKTTAAADLMHCPKRYVVTNTDHLLSPAGFHPDERVFLQTTIAIHTDSLKSLPSSNVKLYAHDLNKGA